MSLFRNTRTIRRRTAEQGGVKRHIVLGVLLLIIIALVLTLVWYLTRRPGVTIHDISIEGGETISHDVVRAAAEQGLNGSYFLLIPHRFSYLYPHDQIVSAVSAIPRVHDVAVGRTSRNEIHITFDEYVPQGLWCLTEEDQSPCYFLDAHGYAFAPAPELHGGTLTRFIVARTTTFATGQAIPQDVLGRINTFDGELESKLGLRVFRVVYTKDYDLELWLAGGGRLLVTDALDVNKTFDTVQTILTSKNFSHLKPGNFNYIDLRFGSKVYVNEEFQSATASSTNESTSSIPVNT